MNSLQRASNNNDFLFLYCSLCTLLLCSYESTTNGYLFVVILKHELCNRYYRKHFEWNNFIKVKISRSLLNCTC